MKKTVKQAFLATIPVLSGYLVLGFGFGIVMKSAGYDLLLAFVMSLAIYAGSMQYVAVGLFAGGASLLTVALTTLMVNARHLFYGISMLEKYKGMGAKKAYLIYGLCDESFSINVSADFPEDADKGLCMFFVTLLNHLYWITGATLGGLLGEIVSFNTKGLDFVMTAMFIVIFLEQWLKEKKHYTALIGVGASVACLLLFGRDSFLIPTMLCMLILLAFFRKPIEKAGGLS